MYTSVSVPEFKCIDYLAPVLTGFQPNDSLMVWSLAGLKSIDLWNFYFVTLIWKQVLGIIVFSILLYTHFIIAFAGKQCPSPPLATFGKLLKCPRYLPMGGVRRVPMWKICCPNFQGSFKVLIDRIICSRC